MMDMGLRNRLLSRITETASGCWIWNGCLNGGGYGLIRIGGRAGRTEKAHRASYVAFVGRIEGGLHVLHKCDVRRCINPDHLFLGTNAENMVDRDAKGRGVIPRLSGERCPWAKLDASSVKEIRRLLDDGATQSSLSARFGVSQALISMICSGERWARNA